MILPTVQLIGAQKSGTSSIADWLFENDSGGLYSRPLTVDGDPPFYSKEVHFFDIGSRYCRGTEFYSSRFIQDTKRPSMDATPDTLQFPERVKEVYDAVEWSGDLLKIIVILRCPIERELSLYNHLVHDNMYLSPSDLNSWHRQVFRREEGTGRPVLMSFDEFVDRVTIPSLLRDPSDRGFGQSSRHGLYAQHLSKWFDMFDRPNQILVLSYDELRSNPIRLQGRIEAFLGRNVAGSLPVANSNNFLQKMSLEDISVETKTKLENLFRPHNDQLYQLLEDHPGPSMEHTPFPKFTGTIISEATTKGKERRRGKDHNIH